MTRLVNLVEIIVGKKRAYIFECLNQEYNNTLIREGRVRLNFPTIVSNNTNKKEKQSRT